MAEAGDIGKTLQLTCYLAEGVATRRDTWEAGGKHIKGVQYSAEIAKGDVVGVWEGALAGEWPIVTASTVDVGNLNSTASSAIGIAISGPIGKAPAISADGGTTTLSAKSHMRTANVEWVGFGTVRKAVVDAAYVAGTRLGYDASLGQFSGNTASVSWFPYVLLESSSAGGTHSVMM